MPTRSPRRSAPRAETSDEFDYLDSPAAPAPRSRKAAPPDSSDDAASDEDVQRRSRRPWDLELGRGGHRRWQMKSLPAGRTPGSAAPQDSRPPEPLVRASNKAPSSRDQGRYAPVSQADPAHSAKPGAAGVSDYSDAENSHPDSGSEAPQHSPPPSDSDVDEKPRSTRPSRSNGSAGAPADGEQPKGGMTRKRWIIVGVLAALIVVINSKKSSDSSSSAAEDKASSTHSKSSTVSRSASSTASGSRLSNATSVQETGTSAPSGLMAGDGESFANATAATALPSNPSATGGAVAAPISTGGLGAPSAPVAAISSQASPLSPVDTFRTTQSAHQTGQPAAIQLTVSIVLVTASPTPATATLPTPASALVKPGNTLGGANIGTWEDWEAAASKSHHAGSKSPTKPAATGAADAGSVTKVSTTASWFAADQHLSACQTTFTNSDLIATVPPAIFGSDGSTVSKLCGARLHVWQPDSDQTITVTVGDVCSGCPSSTALCLSQSAFLALAPGGTGDGDPAAALDAGVISVQWWFDDLEMQAQVGSGFEEWSV